jgi:hypothetical protein
MALGGARHIVEAAVAADHKDVVVGDGAEGLVGFRHLNRGHWPRGGADVPSSIARGAKPEPGKNSGHKTRNPTPQNRDRM